MLASNTGAPQGCVLNPFVYTLYTNEFVFCVVTFFISFLFCDHLFFTHFRCDHELYDEYPF